MSTYTIRFFSLNSIASIVPLQIWLVEQGYYVQPAGTNRLIVFAEGGSLHIELTTAQQELTQRELLAFIDEVGVSPDPNAVMVMDVLVKSQAMIMLAVPDDCDPDLIGDVLGGCDTLGPGLIHVDGEGFYENGELILEVS